MQQAELRTAQLGETGLEITRVGFGAWAIGGSWGDVADDDAVQSECDAAVGRSAVFQCVKEKTEAGAGFFI